MFLFTFWIDSWHYVQTGLATIDKEGLFMFWGSKQKTADFFIIEVQSFFIGSSSPKKVRKLLILGFCLHFESTADMNYELRDTLWKIENSGATLSKALFSTTCRLKALLRYCLSSSFFLGLLLLRSWKRSVTIETYCGFDERLLLYYYSGENEIEVDTKSTLWSHVSWD